MNIEESPYVDEKSLSKLLAQNGDRLVTLENNKEKPVKKLTGINLWYLLKQHQNFHPIINEYYLAKEKTNSNPNDKMRPLANCCQNQKFTQKTTNKEKIILLVIIGLAPYLDHFNLFSTHNNQNELVHEEYEYAEFNNESYEDKSTSYLLPQKKELKEFISNLEIPDVDYEIQIKNQKKKQLIYLIGIFCLLLLSIVSVYFFLKITIENQQLGLSIRSSIAILTLMGIIILIMTFFINTYRESNSKIISLGNEKRDIKLKILRLKGALILGNIEVINSSLEKLTETDRNLILNKKESTTEIKRLKVEGKTNQKKNNKKYLTSDLIKTVSKNIP